MAVTATSPRPTGESTLTWPSPRRWAAPAPASNPEQLFAAGYAACFHSALRLVAGREHAALGDSTVTAQVGIGPDGDAFGLVVTLVIHVPGMERDKVREFAEAAHQVCPYSRATRGNISVELRDPVRRLRQSRSSRTDACDTGGRR